VIKAYVSDRRMTYALDVFLIDERDGSRRIFHTDGETHRWVELPPEGDPVDERLLKPTLVLPYDSGRALLEALTRHYNGAEDTRQLRKDYDAERKRVDDLTSALVSIARASAERNR
jgi:hypothetical protein